MRLLVCSTHHQAAAMATAGRHHTALLLLLLLAAAAVFGERLVAGDCQQALLLLLLLVVVIPVEFVVSWGAHVHLELLHWQLRTELHMEFLALVHWEFSVRALAGPAVCLLLGVGCSRGEGRVLLLLLAQQQQQGEGVLQVVARVVLMCYRCCLINCELALYVSLLSAAPVLCCILSSCLSRCADAACVHVYWMVTGVPAKFALSIGTQARKWHEQHAWRCAGHV
jgi:hypothetical protein